MSLGGHSEPLSLLALFYQSTDVILVSAHVLLVLTLGLWDFGLGLDNISLTSIQPTPKFRVPTPNFRGTFETQIFSIETKIVLDAL